MESTTAHRPVIRDAERLPWAALLVLGTATLVMVTGEMLPTVVLPQMSAGLGVAETSTGLLVSIWAGVVVLASFPLVRVTRSWSPTAVISGSLVVFAGSTALTALAPTYAVAVTGRVLGAAAVGLLWATVNAHVADLVPDRLLGRATAVVLGGATSGMVLGTPLSRLIADLLGWRAAFWVLAAAGVATAVLVRTIVPTRAAALDVPPPAGTIAGRAGASPGSVAPMIAVTVLVAVVLVGHYGVYTYVTRLASGPAEVVPGGMSALLLGFGLASAGGVALAGRVAARTAPALVASVAATAVTVLALRVAESHAHIGVFVVLGWGVASGALPPLAQTLVLRLGGREHRALAGALIPVLFNGGIAVGAALASWLVAGQGLAALPVPAALLVGIAAAGLGLLARAAGRSRAPVSTATGAGPVSPSRSPRPFRPKSLAPREEC